MYLKEHGIITGGGGGGGGGRMGLDFLHNLMQEDVRCCCEN